MQDHYGLGTPSSRRGGAPVQPAYGAFDNPSLGQHDEAADIGSLHDLQIDAPAGTLQAVLKDRPLIPAVCIELEQKREQAEQRAHQQHAAVTILDVSRMDDRVQQKPLRIYKDMPLLSLDLLAGVIARRIDLDPPFSALFTLWLSMMAAVGLASRPAKSRHWI